MSAADRGWGPGWPNCQRDRIVPISVSGVSFPGGVRREVEPIFEAFLYAYEKDVEPLVDGWCWGFACRAIRGTQRPSNHSWGLAIDINAPRHPLGKAGTFNRRQVAEIRRLAAKYDLRWGGDYMGRKDEMHFEYMGTRGAALAWSGSGTLPNEEDGEMLSKGDSGNAVAVFQRALIAWRKESGRNDALPEYGADSDFGDETEKWVRKYQQAADLPETGTIGDVTSALLGRYVAKAAGGGPHGHEQYMDEQRVVDTVRALIQAHANDADAHHE